MYKVSQVAEMLGVNTVKIHEILVIYQSVLKEYVHKENGILMIDVDGYKMLSHQILKGNVIDVSDEKSQIETIEKLDLENVNLQEKENVIDLTNSEDFMLIKSEISDLKQMISKLDIEISKKKKSLLHYQKSTQKNMQTLKVKEADFLRKILK